MPPSNPAIYTFEPVKRSLGTILSNTSPPIRVPDFQRDYSWDKQQIEEFWNDLLSFGAATESLIGREYFLGAAVLVNNGTYHLLLDGQQRLATATILLAALRDRIRGFNVNAADQIQDHYITFEDHLTSARVFKIEMNIFDRAYFRDSIQVQPRVAATPAKKSHHLIKQAYDFFTEKLNDGWTAAGSERAGFDWAARIAQTLREHLVLVTVVSNNEDSAASIFATLNDRGIGLSTVDLIRSMVLQKAHETQRPEIIEKWDAMFNACGKTLGAENLIRMSWVAKHGDIKTRSLYKIIYDAMGAGMPPLLYSQVLCQDAELYKKLREADVEDSGVADNLIALRTFKFNACHPLFFAAYRRFNPDEIKKLTHALTALVIRHNIICDLDRSKIESLMYAAAKMVTDGASLQDVINYLRTLSPDDTQFGFSFFKLEFKSSEHGIARYLLRRIDETIVRTGESTINGPDRVHVEHIYPQTPEPADRWPNHSEYVNRIGNMTLLARPLNTGIRNSAFTIKKANGYNESRIELTRQLLVHTEWTPDHVLRRIRDLCEIANSLWPQILVEV